MIDPRLRQNTYNRSTIEALSREQAKRTRASRGAQEAQRAAVTAHPSQSLRGRAVASLCSCGASSATSIDYTQLATYTKREHKGTPRGHLKLTKIIRT